MIVYNNSIKFKDTIVLGDKQFHKKIREINLPCENIFYLNEEEFYNFCLVPKKISNKYKKCNYFIIMNEKMAGKFRETILYISNVFALFLSLLFMFKIKILKLINNYYKSLF